jgi:protein O-GlcNAc transferase
LPLTPDELLAQGRALDEQGDFQGAITLYQQAIALDIHSPQGYMHLGNALYVAGYVAEATGIFDIALGNIPGSVALNWARCMATLPLVYIDSEELRRVRAEFTARLNTLRAVCFKTPADLRESVRSVGVMSPFYLAYQGRNDRRQHEVHGALLADIMGANFPRYTMRPHVAWTNGEPIRIGVVCGLFRRHSVWRLPTRGWVEGLDRSRFQLLGYHTRLERDDQTDYAAGCFDRFVQASASPAHWAETITRDAPHVLIFPELAADQTCLQLASLRLAPVQCTSWGQPVTSGLPTVDYYLSSDLMEPPDAAAHYSEKLVRLPGLGAVCQTDYASWGDVLPTEDIWEEVDEPQNVVRIACCQSLPKYLPEHDDIFPRISLQVPTARFLFVGTQRRGMEILSARLDAAFTRYGLAFDAFCRFVETLPVARFSAMIRNAHIFLDTPLWSGCNTTLDAIGHAIPIVTMPGPMMRGRHGSAILTLAGVTDTIARTPDEYISIAVGLAKDVAWRGEISARLAAGRAQVFGDTSPVRALEAFLMDAVAQVDLD